MRSTCLVWQLHLDYGALVLLDQLAQRDELGAADGVLRQDRQILAVQKPCRPAWLALGFVRQQAADEHLAAQRGGACDEAACEGGWGWASIAHLANAKWCV
jgi:hypothetical protein